MPNPNVRRVLCLLLIAALTLPLSGQSTYGGQSPGSGGIQPIISCNQAYFGNLGWGVGVSQGLGGASGLLGLSTIPQSLNLGGIPLNIDIGPGLVFLLPITLSGPVGTPGAGNFFLPVPLAGPPVPVLSGTNFYWQAAVIDAAGVGGLAMTRGLRAELTMPPQIFVGSSVGGSLDPHWFVNPLTSVLDYPTGGNTNTNNVDGGTYADGGRTLYVVSGFGSISRCDLSGAAPVWSTLITLAGTSGPAEGNLQLDPIRKRIWTYADPGTGIREFLAIDVDALSATYGQVVAQTNGASANVGLVGTWALSADGNYAAVPGLLGGNVYIFDLDPSSATFGTLVDVAPIPVSGASSLWFPTDIIFSPDGDYVLLIMQGTGTTPAEIARYHRPTLTWIDHNATVPGLQNMGPAALPAVPMLSAPTSLEIDRNGNFLAVAGNGGSGWMGRIGLNPSSPFVWSWTPGPATGTNGWRRAAINSDGDRIAVNATSPHELRIYDSTSLLQLSTVPLPSGTASGNVIWR